MEKIDAAIAHIASASSRGEILTIDPAASDPIHDVMNNLGHAPLFPKRAGEENAPDAAMLAAVEDEMKLVSVDSAKVPLHLMAPSGSATMV